MSQRHIVRLTGNLRLEAESHVDMSLDQKSPGINGEGELRGQPANPGSPGKMAVKTVCTCVYMCVKQCRLYAHTHRQIDR